MSEEADVRLWGGRIGVVLQEDDGSAAVFGYEPQFVRSGIQIAPLTMPLREAPYSFPELSFKSFRGLPGLLADSLPDKWGNALIDTWLETQGRPAESVKAIERLLYIGARGMGALEFEPREGPLRDESKEIQVEDLVRLASEVLTERKELVALVKEGQEREALLEVLSVGISPGGARAKAVIAWNRATREIRSGQVDAPKGFEHWLLKFDGVGGNRDKEQFEDPKGYGAIEFAYSKMARAAGIEMTECELLEEGPRRHFMTRRFDRLNGNEKLHMQSLGAMAHFDYNEPGARSYEQAIRVIRSLGLSMDAVEEQFRRMVFNVVGRNQDDHVKNIAFLMDKAGDWSLSPAFDVTFNFKPSGDWTYQHQMTVNGKSDGFTLEDFQRAADTISMQRKRAAEIVDQVRGAVSEWSRFAAEVSIDSADIRRIAEAQRLDLPKR